MSDIPLQTDIPDQQSGGIHSEPVWSRGYSTNSPAPTLAKSNNLGQPPAREVSFKTHTFKSTRFKVESVRSTTIVSPNPRRRSLTIQNVGAGNAQLAFGADAFASGENSIDLLVGTSISFSIICPNNEISAICTPTTVISVLEGFEDE